MSDVVFLDVETTGLDPKRHRIWEIGLIDDGQEHSWYLNPDMIELQDADPNALRITGFYDRFPSWWGSEARRAAPKDIEIARTVAECTAGKHLVGAVPSFDAAFLEAFLRGMGLAPAWHYHLVDVEALVAGKLGLRPPWDSDELSGMIGIPGSRFRKHEALEDARWAKAMYEAVLGPVVE